jgi:hypothetical protein
MIEPWLYEIACRRHRDFALSVAVLDAVANLPIAKVGRIGSREIFDFLGRRSDVTVRPLAPRRVDSGGSSPG